MHRVAVLPGDGIGRDVMEAARLVLDALPPRLELTEGEVGWECWRREGTPLPERTVRLLEATDCCLFGAITSKPDQEAEAELDPIHRGKGLRYRSPIVEIRQRFHLRSNFRPCRAYPGNPLNYREGIDITVVRENTEGLYAGVEFHPTPREVRDALAAHAPAMARFAAVADDDLALAVRVISRSGARAVVEDGYAYAVRKGYRKVTVVEKPNVLRRTSGLVLEEARRVAAAHPGIVFEDLNIDAACMALVKRPNEFSVIVATNLFGDIVSDLCAQLVGGLGFAPSASIGKSYALFEPVHGSAPKYAGKGIANPVAMILTVGLMLEHLGEGAAAARIERAVAEVVRAGRVRTRDMGGAASTTDMARAVAEAASDAA